MSCRIIGVGGYLPPRCVSNHELSTFVDTDHEWISSKTGITQRYFADESQSTSDLAYLAALNAIQSSHFSSNDIDLVIACTSTGDSAFPSVAAVIQGKLHIPNNAPAFDINAACGGFLYGLHVAVSMIKSGAHKKVLLVGVDKMSNLLNFEDRSTAILFGDGAGAIILEATEDATSICDSLIYSDGTYSNILYVDRLSRKICMLGPEVYKHAVNKMSAAASEILSKNGLSIDDIDFVVPHQANLRIIDAVAKKLHIPNEKIVTTVEVHANTSAASIPLALYELKHKLQPGTKLLLTAIGAGLAWGSAIVTWL